MDSCPTIQANLHITKIIVVVYLSAVMKSENDSLGPERPFLCYLCLASRTLTFCTNRSDVRCKVEGCTCRRKDVEQGGSVVIPPTTRKQVQVLQQDEFSAQSSRDEVSHDICSVPMPSLLSPSQHDAAALSAVTIPLALVVPSTLKYTLTSSAKHSLFASAAAWFILCAWSTTRVGAKSLVDAHASQRLAWTAGGLVVLAQVCERAVDGRGLWWTKVNFSQYRYDKIRNAG